MDYYSKQINRLVEALSMLPGIGSKTAQRLAFHILSMPREDAERLATSSSEARSNVRYCRECFTLPDLQRRKTEPQGDHGGGEYEGSGSI